jgi:hypothetical protein
MHCYNLFMFTAITYKEKELICLDRNLERDPWPWMGELPTSLGCAMTSRAHSACLSIIDCLRLK